MRMPISEQDNWGGAEPWTGSLVRLRSSWHGLPGLWEWTQTPAPGPAFVSKEMTRIQISTLTGHSCLMPVAF